jgi:hypothetical protein
MGHRINRYAAGETCSMCRSPATHKVGEEIPSTEDECPWCKTSLSYFNLACPNVAFHKQPQMHNLTAYVCCFCYTTIMGPASECQLSDTEKYSLAYRRSYTKNPEEDGLENCHYIRCIKCHHALLFTGFNAANTLAFIDCPSCQTCSVVDNQ